jgi:NAD(P)H dehydrogenase (quinone)
VIVTMGMPGWLYKWYLESHAVRTLHRNILSFVGIAPVRTRILGGVEAVSQAERTRWTREVEALGAAAR